MRKCLRRPRLAHVRVKESHALHFTRLSIHAFLLIGKWLSLLLFHNFIVSLKQQTLNQAHICFKVHSHNNGILLKTFLWCYWWGDLFGDYWECWRLLITFHGAVGSPSFWDTSYWGYFHLVGVIFIHSGVKFTIPRIKWNERHFALWQVCNFFGKQCTWWFIFELSRNFPSKIKKLESLWLIAIFSNCEE